MFTYGTLDANATPGLMGLLAGFPQLAAPAVATVESPGSDGAFFAHANLGQGGFTFELTALAPTPTEVLAIADDAARALDPRRGLQPLTMSIAPGWVWAAVVDTAIEWSRGLWVIGQECQLHAEVHFRTPDPHAYKHPDDVATRTGAGVLSIDRDGNAPSHPRLSIAGTLSATQTITITAPGYTLNVKGPLTTGQTLRLDWAALDFGIWQGTTKTTSAVPRMDNYARLVLEPGASAVSVTSSGTLGQIQLEANSRRS